MTETILLRLTDGVIQNPGTLRTWAKKQKQDGWYEGKLTYKKKRSNPQNRYYYGCLLPLVVEGLQNIGYSDVKEPEDAHEILKHLFLKKRFVNEDKGEEIIIAGSTAKLSTIMFNAYLEEIWRWSSEYLGVTIPAPSEQLNIYEP